MKSEIAFLQRKVTPHSGGGEMFALRFLGELKKSGDRITILANSVHSSLLDRFDFVRVRVLKPFSFLKMLSFAWYGYRAARGKNYDLIFSNERTFYHHIYFAGEGCHGEWLRRRFRQISSLKKFFIRVNPLHWTLFYLEKRCLSNPILIGVISFSQRVKKELIENHRIPENKIKVVYHGVPARGPNEESIDRDTLRKDLGIGADELALLFIGSGFERKGLRFLIESLAHFQHSNFRLLVVGKGRKAPYARLAKQLRVDEKVHFYGQNPNARLFYSAADIFVLPTLYEPFGLVVLEAMTHGLPVVVSQFAGAAELVTHRKNGLILQDPLDAREIGACLNELGDPELRKKIGAAGRGLAAEYTLEKSARETLRAVEEFRKLQ